MLTAQNGYVFDIIDNTYFVKSMSLTNCLLDCIKLTINGFFLVVPIFESISCPFIELIATWIPVGKTEIRLNFLFEIENKCKINWLLIS